MGTSGNDVEAGFAKLQGEDFEYYMQTYSIILGRNSKKSTVDVDLSSLGGGMNISRHHARIFYDFARRRFALEVLGKNGCLVEGVLHLPGNPPVKLDSQDLLQIGDKEFYFLLPVRSILGGHLGLRHHVNVVPQYHSGGAERMAGPVAVRKAGRGRESYEEEFDDDEDEDDIGGSSGKKRREGLEGFGYGAVGGSGGKPGLAGALVPSDKKLDGRSRVDRESDNQQLLQLEEKDVVSSVATVLSDLCGPGEWMPMEKLHAELLEHYSNVWHHSRVRRYLTSEEWPGPESKGKPWYGLLMLLRKYPEHFVINTRSKNRVTLEFVSLVSLLS
ncbi:FHA domain-containing protein FHA2 isoform X2 [Ricinus communis]|uniref:Transcriptional activator, putative n=1 Tax=Ricinus communis TaxID=3988 RepID=B9T3B9_RICCO|nr:FHA domain-containing protein FHA2 isoform X2 [Ricinus communis]EEF29640.1 transcriptional activator, putative [Ricinus communis]|eukprot:XP_002532738.1 FHA domain-containing protein FHA2 isoform X2 [Ricinus communis]